MIILTDFNFNKKNLLQGQLFNIKAPRNYAILIKSLKDKILLPGTKHALL